jgi:hypothetical protein
MPAAGATVGRDRANRLAASSAECTDRRCKKGGDGPAAGLLPGGGFNPFLCGWTFRKIPVAAARDEFLRTLTAPPPFPDVRRHLCMATEVVCPDCNKLIAPAGSVEELARCHCGEDFSRPSTRAFQPTPETKPKHCYVCGVDLSHQVRLKDHLGRYWCQDCTDAERRAKQREAELKCADCGRIVGATKLFNYDDVRLCRTCMNQRVKESKQKLKQYGAETAAKRSEWNRIKWLAIIATVLIVLATLNQLFG